MIELNLIMALLGWAAAGVVAARLLPGRWQVTGAMVCGIGLLASISPVGLAVTVGGGLATFGIGKMKQRRGAAIALAIAVIAIGYLVLLRLAAPALGSGGVMSPQKTVGVLILPFGLAYTSLRLIHYLMEVHKGGLRPHGVGDYLAYLLLPPVLAVGPIHRFEEFQRDLARRRWDPDQFNAGAGRVLRGAVKVVILGNYLMAAKLTPWLVSHAAGLPWLKLWLTAALYWVNLYIQFSGYCDIAIGLAAMMGFRIRENFQRPYFASNIAEFWRRWHMSLTSWCRDYVYVPVLAIGRRPMAALAASMIALGLWHAVSMRYLLWGLYHAIGIMVRRAFHHRTASAIAAWPEAGRKAWAMASGFVTLNFVVMSFPVIEAVERLFGGLNL